MAMQNMKVAVVYPFLQWNAYLESKICFESEEFAIKNIYPCIRWASWDIANYVEKGFKKIGIKTLSFKPLDESEIFEKETKLSEKFKYVKFNRKYTTYFIFENMLKKLVKEKPNIVLFIHGSNIPFRFIKSIKDIGIITAVWLMDDPHEIDHSKTYSHFYDFVFTTEKNAVEIHSIRNKNVYYLPCGYDEETFYPKEDKRYESDICIIGSGFPERINLLENIYPYIKDLNTRIIGNWEQINKDSPLKKLIEKNFVEPKEASLYYSNAKIVLNQHRMPYLSTSLSSNINHIEGISPNPRLFEASACGAFSIINEERYGCFEFFEKGKEIDSFSTPIELVEKIKFWIKNDELRKIAKKMVIEKNKKNTYSKRCEKIIEVCTTKLCVK